MKGKTIEQLAIGDRASFEKTISETDVYLYAGITGDLNPAHINERLSSQTRFEGRIAHGMLTAGLVSTVLGMYLPGPGTIYLSQQLNFTFPVKIGDTIKAEAEVVEILEDQKKVKLSTKCYNQNNQIVLEGFAIVKPPK
jgi:3-hydroxybutyryl-CoA dehydratase